MTDTDEGGLAPASATSTWYASDLDPEELAFQRLYGPWRPFSVVEADEVFAPLEIPWWIAGGYAIEAFTGVRRHHEDIDVSVFRRDVGVLRAAFEGTFHVWSAGAGMFRPLTDEFPDPHDQSDQVWLREHALAPWRADVLLNPDQDGAWVSRRDGSFAALSTRSRGLVMVSVTYDLRSRSPSRPSTPGRRTSGTSL